jgi:hypothetical protein
MGKLEARGVEHQARRKAAGRGTVFGVAEHWVADGREVYPELVHPSGQRLELDQRRTRRDRLEHAVARDGFLAVLRRHGAQVSFGEGQADLAGCSGR